MQKQNEPYAPIRRILVVDDFEPIRRRYRSLLAQRPEWQVVGEAADGWEAVQKARELAPDLILLDLGLPGISGIDVARHVHHWSPGVIVVLVTQQAVASVAEDVLSATGALGYVAKSDAGRQLLPALEAVLRGESFTSSSVTDGKSFPACLSNLASRRDPVRDHAVQFFRDDDSFVRSFSDFVEQKLMIGNVVIAITDSRHRAGIIRTVRERGLDIAGSLEKREFIALDVVEMLSKFVEGDVLNEHRFLTAAADLFALAAENPSGVRPVAVCGECAPTLLADGKTDAAIDLEALWDEHFAVARGVNTLCGYVLDPAPNRTNMQIIQRICAEHSEAYGADLT